jgi:DNA-binding beta-propeller fold protein YncE
LEIVLKTFEKMTVRAVALVSLCLGGNSMANEQPLNLIRSVPLPAVTGGDFDHFTVDLRKDRLFVPAEVYGSIEVFTLHTGEHLKSVTGIVRSPHLLFYVPQSNELFVADTGDAACDVFDTSDFHLTKRIALEPGPDTGVFDDESRILYLGNGGRHANASFSYISLISVDRKEVLDRIRVEAATLKGMIIDRKTQRLFVSMRDKNQVGVVDLRSRRVSQTWSAPGLNSNAALAFDQANHRLFVGSRDPGVLFVLDSDSGKLMTTVKTVNTSDDMTYDAARRRLIISGSDGVDVFSQESPDSYRLIQHVDTLGGKTSIQVPSLRQFYVVHTKSEQVAEAGLQVFKVND